MANKTPGEANDGTNESKGRQKAEDGIGRKFVSKAPRTFQGKVETCPPWTGMTARMVGGDSAKQR
jgi:hypothetical protein